MKFFLCIIWVYPRKQVLYSPVLGEEFVFWELSFKICVIVFVVWATVFKAKWFNFFSMKAVVHFWGNIKSFIGLIFELGCCIFIAGCLVMNDSGLVWVGFIAHTLLHVILRQIHFYSKTVLSQAIQFSINEVFHLKIGNIYIYTIYNIYIYIYILYICI